MKNLIYKKYIKYYVLLLVAMSFTACDTFLDVDTDKDNPTVAALNQLLPNIEVTVAKVGDHRVYSGEILMVYTHQLQSRSEQDQYGAQSPNTSVNNDWNNIYLVLTDIETLIRQAEVSGDKVYLGVGQALKAYVSSVAVDIWGDVPYSEATQLTSGIVSPVFDDQQAIYQEVLALLDTAKANISSNEGALKPSTDDLFFSGSRTKWVKFINSFKLKLYNQIRLSPLYNQADVNALVAENNFMASSADDFQFKHTANITPSDERNELFRGSYGSAQVDHYVSPWFYEILKGMNPNIHNGNVDPRIPYYWANQLAPGVFPRDQGNSVTGNPNADYWDTSTGFFSIRFGSIGPDRDHAVQTDATFPGIFPCGGRYDTGTGFARTIASGTGVAPRRIFTYDEFLYVQAEMMQVGLITGDAGAKLTQALAASFKKVDEVVTGTGTTQTVPKLVGSANVTTFMGNISSEFAAASAAKKLEIIMTQKWVATYGDHLDQYNDYRRTGYPIWPNPNGSSPEYQLDNGDAYPLDDSKTVLGNSYQLSLFWPNVEISSNQNSPSQKDVSTYKIFWDN